MSFSFDPPRRRAFVRFFACEQDLSHEPPDAPLPDAVAQGAEPFRIVGFLAAFVVYGRWRLAPLSTRS